jgi:hypothetical protein
MMDDKSAMVDGNTPSRADWMVWDDTFGVDVSSYFKSGFV